MPPTTQRKVNLPEDLMILILLPFLTMTDLYKLVRVSVTPANQTNRSHHSGAVAPTQLDMAIFTNLVWNTYLLPHSHDATIAASAVRSFMFRPEARLPRYMDIDQRGEEYLRQLTVFDLQRKHLTALPTEKRLRAGRVTVVETLASTTPQALVDVTGMRYLGIEVGLTREQVDAIDNCQTWHLQAMLAGIAAEELVGLSPVQVNGLTAGLSRDQVNHVWFDNNHVNAHRAGLAYEAYQGLESYAQVQGLMAGLSRDQVNHDWFRLYHVRAHQAGIAYDAYKDCTREQVLALIKAKMPTSTSELPPTIHSERVMPSIAIATEVTLATTSITLDNVDCGCTIM